MITKPAYRRLCTLTFSKSVFVGFRYSPRSDEKRLTSHNSVAYSSFPRSSKLINNRLVWKSVMRTEPIHIKKFSVTVRISSCEFSTYNSIFSVTLKPYTQPCLLSMFTVCYKLFLSTILHVIRCSAVILCISEHSRDRNKP